MIRLTLCVGDWLLVDFVQLQNSFLVLPQLFFQSHQDEGCLGAELSYFMLPFFSDIVITINISSLILILIIQD